MAAAVTRAFPNAKILRGGATDIGFYYDFLFEHPVSKDAFELIEEHIRALTVEEIKVKSSAMIRQNAREFFNYKKEPLKASELKSSPAEVQILQIGDFYDECPLPHPSDLKGFRALKLLDIEIFNENGRVVTRITGTIFPDQNHLKEFLKKLKNHKGHQEIGLQKKLFASVAPAEKDGWILGPLFCGIIDVFKGIWKDFCFEKGLEVVFSGRGSPQALLSAHSAYAAAISKSPPIRVAEFYRKHLPVENPYPAGLLGANACWSDMQHVFCEASQVPGELNSYLHFIDKWNKMLSIEGEWVLAPCGKRTQKSFISWERAEALLVEAFEKNQAFKPLRTESIDSDFEKKSFIGPRLEYYFIDELGRRWLGSSLGLWTSFPNINSELKEESLWIIGCSFFNSVECIAALLLEKGIGSLPFWVLPEQMRIFPLSEKQESYADEIELRCRMLGYRARSDKRKEPLSKKVESMERDGVGFGLFIGDIEQAENKISIRSGFDRSEQKLIGLNEFFEQIEIE